MQLLLRFSFQRSTLVKRVTATVTDARMMSSQVRVWVRCLDVDYVTGLAASQPPGAGGHSHP